MMSDSAPLQLCHTFVEIVILMLGLEVLVEILAALALVRVGCVVIREIRLNRQWLQNMCTPMEQEPIDSLVSETKDFKYRKIKY